MSTYSPGRRYWIAALFLATAPLAAMVPLLQKQQADMVSEARTAAHTELQMLRAFAQTALQKQDYQHLPGLLQEWGARHTDTREIQLTAANGFSLALYRRSEPAADTLTLSERIPYSYKGVATLELSKDLAPVYARIGRSRGLVLSAGGALVVALQALLWAWWRGSGESSADRLRSQQQADADTRVAAAEHELRQMGSQLQSLMDAIPNVLAGVDRQGRVTLWNKEAERTVLIKREDALGHPIGELLPDLRGLKDWIDAAVQDGKIRHSPRITSLRGGTVRYFDVNVYPSGGSGQRSVLIRVDDVTRQVHFERLMVQTEKMMSLGGLAAGVAHELNSPLSGVLQNCQNLHRRLSGDLAANRRVADAVGIDLARLQDYLGRRDIPQLLKLVRESAERASLVVGDMLAFSRRGTTHMEKVSVTQLIDSVVRLASSDLEMRTTYGFPEVELHRELDPDLSLIYCDRTRIEQVLFNLVKNASQAMSLADTAPPRHVHIRARREDADAVIEVEDNGPGMDEETSRQSFEPFFTTKAPGVGTGLGLSVAQFIVTEQHGGSIEVRSSPGMGSLFRIRLPLPATPVARGGTATAIDAT